MATTLGGAGYVVSVICPKGRGYVASEKTIDGIHVYRHPLPVVISQSEGLDLLLASIEYIALYFQRAAGIRCLRRASSPRRCVPCGNPVTKDDASAKCRGGDMLPFKPKVLREQSAAMSLARFRASQTAPRQGDPYRKLRRRCVRPRPSRFGCPIFRRNVPGDS